MNSLLLSNHCTWLVGPLRLKIQGGCRSKELVCIEHVKQKTRNLGETMHQTSLFPGAMAILDQRATEIPIEASGRRNFLGISHV